MIKTELVSPDLLEIVVPERLCADDFLALAPQIEAITKQHGKISLLIDASRLERWDNLAAVERHFAFVRDHQDKVERIAVIARHEWQHWLVGGIGVFLHPEIRVFDAGHADEARCWIAVQEVRT